MTERFRRTFEEINNWNAAMRTLAVPETAPTPARRAALSRAKTTHAWLLRAMRTLGNADAAPANVRLATALVDVMWSAYMGHGVEQIATMELLRLIERAASGAPTENAAQWRRSWGRDLDASAFERAVAARKARGAWWPHAVAAIRSAGLKPQSVAALKRAWKRIRTESPLERLLGVNGGDMESP